METALALLEEVLHNGNNGKDALYAWFLGEKNVIEQVTEMENR